MTMPGNLFHSCNIAPLWFCKGFYPFHVLPIGVRILHHKGQAHFNRFFYFIDYFLFIVTPHVRPPHMYREQEVFVRVGVYKIRSGCLKNINILSQSLPSIIRGTWIPASLILFTAASYPVFKFRFRNLGSYFITNIDNEIFLMFFQYFKHIGSCPIVNEHGSFCHSPVASWSSIIGIILFIRQL